MMNHISEQEEAGVRLVTVELSEDEAAMLVASLEYGLAHADDDELERLFGAYRDEIEAVLDDLKQILAITAPELDRAA
jgi:hypothetical protein